MVARSSRAARLAGHHHTLRGPSLGGGQTPSNRHQGPPRSSWERGHLNPAGIVTPAPNLPGRLASRICFPVGTLSPSFAPLEASEVGAPSALSLGVPGPVVASPPPHAHRARLVPLGGKDPCNLACPELLHPLPSPLLSVLLLLQPLLSCPALPAWRLHYPAWHLQPAQPCISVVQPGISTAQPWNPHC